MFGKKIWFSGVRLGCWKSLRIFKQLWSEGWKLSQFSGHLCPQTWDTVSESVGKLMTTFQTCYIKEMEIMCMKMIALGSVCSSAAQGWNSRSVPSLRALSLLWLAVTLPASVLPCKTHRLSSQCHGSDLAQSCPAVHVVLQQLIWFSSNAQFLSRF